MEVNDLVRPVENVKQTADRDVASEAGLLWSGVAICVFLTAVFFGPSINITGLLEIHPLAAAAILGFAVAGVSALFYHRHFAKKVEAARTDHNEIMKIKRRRCVKNTWQK